jgi:hypothetical protein
VLCEYTQVHLKLNDAQDLFYGQLTLQRTDCCLDHMNFKTWVSMKETNLVIAFVQL